MTCAVRESFTTAYFTVNVSTADVFGLGVRVRNRVWVMVWVRVKVRIKIIVRGISCGIG